MAQLEASFLVREPISHQVLFDALLDDIQNAKLSWKFKLYYRLRWMIPIFARQLLQRRRNTTFELPDNWYIPITIRRLADSLADTASEVLHPWPDAKEFGFVLTHDVETKYGVGLIDKMAKIEEKHGFRSCWNLIPKKYVADQGLLNDLHARGFEVGVHGFNHDGRLFESKRKFLARSEVINQFAKRFKASGFRAPMVHRDLELIVNHLDFDYDASCFDIDPFQAMAGGVGSIWPFMIGNDYVELPYTMPQDHTLFVSLGQTDTGIWDRKFEYLKRNCGMVLLLTHPDYMDTKAKLDMYDRFLGRIAEEENGWSALPSGVASWWTEREQAMHQLELDPTSAHRCSSEFGKFFTSSFRAEGSEIRIEPLMNLKTAP